MRLDLLRQLFHGRQTVEGLRHGDDFDSVLAVARQRGEIVDVGSAGPSTNTPYLSLATATRAELDRLATDGAPSFLDIDNDDVGRRFMLSVEEELPDGGAARRLREEAARYEFVRGDARVERAKATALVSASIGKVASLLRHAHEEDAADSLASHALGDPLNLDVAAALIRDVYAPLLSPVAAKHFGMAVAEGADRVHELYTRVGDARWIAESLGSAFGVLVVARLAAAGDAFEALSAVKEVA